jgi:uncharacterized protein YbbK (DUF523 family)
MRPILVSACLLGLATRFDGTTKRNERVLAYLRSENRIPIPVCPEQLAGLPTPRPQTWFAVGSGAEVLVGTGEVVNCQGLTMNEPFVRGANETLRVARLAGCTEALLKERSPSCGVHQIHRDRQIVSGLGVASALLDQNGIKVFSEEDLV